MRLFYIISLALSTAVAAKNFEYKIKENHAVPHGFTRDGPAPPSQLIHLQILLHQPYWEDLEKRLLQISDPAHIRYGQHLTRQQADRLGAPSKHTLVQVEQWLEDAIGFGVESSLSGNTFSLKLSVAQTERLLDTHFSIYRHSDGTTLVRAPVWKLPAHLHEHVATIQPTTAFMRQVPQAQAWRAGQSRKIDVAERDVPTSGSLYDVSSECNASALTPACLRALYGTQNYHPQRAGTNRLGLTNFRNQVNNRSDISIFLQQYRPEAVSAAQDFRLVSVNGGTVQQTPLNASQLAIRLGGEGDLDAEYLLALAWPTPLTSWSTAGAPPFLPDADSKPYTEIEPYLVWLNYLLAQPDDALPQVISNSYADDEQTVPPAYARVVCAKFALLAARGVTVLTGSGDGGVGGVAPGGHCRSNRDNSTQFVPLFPATCPYVTVVGGTAGFAPEVAAFDLRYNFSSGGGFSNYFPRPPFQSATTPAYLPHIPPGFSALYNATGRAYPDLAAASVNYTQIWNGTTLIVDGTSAATPAMAAVVSLLNDALLAAGRPVLGWMNPWLYAGGGRKGFADVVQGSAAGCGGSGFPAVRGWDAVTGWGTPRFDRLLEAVGLDPRDCRGLAR